MFAVFHKKQKTFLDIESQENAPSLIATSPITDSDRTTRAFSFDFTLPYSPKNDNAFGHAYRTTDRTDAASDAKEVIIYNAGRPLIEGTLTLQNITAKGYNVYFKSAGRELPDLLADWNITKIFDTIPLTPQRTPRRAMYRFRIDIPTYQNQHKLNINAKDIILNTDLTTPIIVTTPEQVAAAVVQANIDFKNKINIEFPNLATYNPTTDCIEIDPSGGKEVKFDFDTYTNIIFLEIFSEAEHKLEKTKFYVEDWFLQRVENQYFVFPLAVNGNYYDGKIKRYSGFINDMLNADFKEANQIDFIKDSWATTLIPYPYLHQVILRIFQKIGKALYGDVPQNAQHKSLIVESLTAIDEVSEVQMPSNINTLRGNLIKYYNHFTAQVNVGDHLPDQNAREFLVNICKTLGYYTRSEKTAVFLEHSKELYDTRPRDWSAKYIAYTLERTRIERKGYTLHYTADSNDITDTKLRGISPSVFKSGEGKKDIALPLSIGRMQDRYLRTPYAHQTGKSAAAGTSSTGSPAKILQYKGINTLQDTVQGFAAQYAYADTGYLDLAATPSVLPSLQDIAALDTAEPIRADFYLTADDVKDFIECRYARARFTTEAGPVLAFIKSIEFKNEHTPARLEMLLLEYN